MRICLFSDLHCNNWSQFSHTLPDGRNSRLVDCLGVFDKVEQVAKEHNCKMIVFLGDLFENRRSLENDAAFHTIQRIRELSGSFEGKIIFLRGNHDCYDDKGAADSLAGIRDCVEVIDSPSLQVHAGCAFWFIPWQSQPKEYFQGMFGDDDSPNSPLLLFMHQSVSEGFLANGLQRTGSLDLADIPISECKRVFAGDYHRHQELAGGKFMYVGSPIQLNFGEAGQEKFIIVYDTNSDEVLKIPTDAPQFHTFESIDAATKWSNQHEDSQDFVRVTLSGKITEKQQEKIDALGEKLRHVTFELQPVEQLEERCDTSVVASDTLLMDEYLEQRAEPEQRESLLAAGLELLYGAVA